MKLHIECLQEKLDVVTKEKDTLQQTNEENASQHTLSVEKLNKIIKTLEEELTNKADKIKAQEAKIGELKIEAS